MLIAPSILAADFAHLAKDIDAVADADWIHVDVMDNHFVPNLTIGLPVVQAVLQVTELPVDCHLMIADPLRWAPPYARAGAHVVTFHVEAALAAGQDPAAVAQAIRAEGALAGLALKPGTPWAPYEHLLDEVDLVLVMTVEPGFGGQSFLEDQLAKVRAVRESVRAHAGPVRIQVDGGVAADTIGACAQAGADVFVAGSAVFGAQDRGAQVRRLRALAIEGR